MSNPLDALLVIAPGCPHCAGMLETLSWLIKEGKLAAMEVVNAAQRPDRVPTGVRSAPWWRLGPFELDGNLPPGVLESLARHGDAPRGWAVFFDLLFTRGARVRVESLIREDPARIAAFALLLEDPQVEMHTRLGVGAVMEELRGSGIATPLVEPLNRLSRHPEARVRGDACYLLSLTGSLLAKPALQARTTDNNREVAEIAIESLQELEQELGKFR